MHRSSPLVLLPHRFPHNIYVRELGRAYISLGCEVVYGQENFFESNLAPDVLHVQWPEDLYRAACADKSARGRNVLERIETFKNRGATIAWTVHNEIPHESTPGIDDATVYQGIIDRADVIHHHCERSRELIRSRYEVGARVSEFVAPHGHYFGYLNDVGRDAARRRLEVPPDSFVYLHFGAIRGYKGLEHVLSAFKKTRQRDALLIVAGRPAASMDFSSRLRLFYRRRLRSGIRFHLQPIPSDEIQIFFNAADAVVLGHTRGLNSGVAVLGMSFGKAVIGPDLGCVPDVLGQGRNLVYANGDYAELVDKLIAARRLAPESVADDNRAAAANWKWEDIADPIIRAWRQRNAQR